MPTYDYECDACGHEFELFQTISEPVLTKCPECKKKKLRRLFGIGAAVMFKGSGFYQTDYRSDSYKKAAEADKKSTSDSTTSSGGDAKSNSGKSESAASSSSSEESPAKKESQPKKKDKS